MESNYRRLETKGKINWQIPALRDIYNEVIRSEVFSDAIPKNILTTKNLAI